MGNLNQQSSNSIFGGDSQSKPVATKSGAKGNNKFTDIVADDADDDWDVEDTASSSKINQKDNNGMGFFNRAPLNQH